MADIALTENLTMSERATLVRRIGYGDARFRFLTRSAALLVIAIFVGVLVTLLIGAQPSIQAFGWDFLKTQKWNPVTQHFGALDSIYGTLVTSFGAMLLAVPVGIGIATPGQAYRTNAVMGPLLHGPAAVHEQSVRA